MKINKIGWQKYENILEQQLDNPLLDVIMGRLPEIPENQYSEESEGIQETLSIPVDDSMMESLALTANFDCWMGHTNFNLTTDIRDILNKVEGIEVLKICSRYRFFVGIGQMFDFKNVRRHIEDELDINQGEYFEN